MLVLYADNYILLLQVFSNVDIITSSYTNQSCILGAEALGQATFGEGTGRIWLDNVQCTENETSILNCSVAASGVNFCTHDQDAGVRCAQGMDPLINGVLD